jgi:hypothetical protein
MQLPGVPVSHPHEVPKGWKKGEPLQHWGAGPRYALSRCASLVCGDTADGVDEVILVFDSEADRDAFLKWWGPDWCVFECRNPACGWKTPGTFNWQNLPGYEGCLPDSDCPKCGFHDSVVDGTEVIAAPEDIEAVRKDINSGPYTK